MYTNSIQYLAIQPSDFDLYLIDLIERILESPVFLTKWNGEDDVLMNKIIPDKEQISEDYIIPRMLIVNFCSINTSSSTRKSLIPLCYKRLNSGIKKMKLICRIPNFKCIVITKEKLDSKYDCLINNYRPNLDSIITIFQEIYTSLRDNLSKSEISDRMIKHLNKNTKIKIELYKQKNKGKDYLKQYEENIFIPIISDIEDNIDFIEQNKQILKDFDILVKKYHLDSTNKESLYKHDLAIIHLTEINNMTKLGDFYIEHLSYIIIHNMKELTKYNYSVYRVIIDWMTHSDDNKIASLILPAYFIFRKLCFKKCNFSTLSLSEKNIKSSISSSSYLIMTAVEIEEEAVKRLPDVEFYHYIGHFNQGKIYKLYLKDNGTIKDTTVYLSNIGSTGRVSAAMHTQAVIEAIKPQFIIFSGIAGSFKKVNASESYTKSVGHLVIANSAYDYPPAKIVEREIKPRGLFCTFDLYNSMNVFCEKWSYKDKEYFELAKSLYEYIDYSKELFDENCKYLGCDIDSRLAKKQNMFSHYYKDSPSLCTVDQVIADDEKKNEILELVFPNLIKPIALEMESAIIQMIVNKYDNNIKVGIVRGISDDATRLKSDFGHPFASVNAAKFTVDFINWHIKQKKTDVIR